MIDYLLLIFFSLYIIIIIVTAILTTLLDKRTDVKEPIIISKTLKNRSSKDSKIPKIIWAYWQSKDGSTPEFVNKCLESLKYHNKDHQVIILNNENVEQYIPGVDFKSLLEHTTMAQHLTDFIRLHLLRIHGGIWCDASIICNKPFSEWVHKLSPEYEFIGFTLPNLKFEMNKNDYSISMNEHIRKELVIENWFLAAEKGSEFIRLWCEEAMRINSFQNRKEYVLDLHNKHVCMKNIELKMYLTTHLSAMKVIQLNNYPLQKLKIYESIYTAYFFFSNSKLSLNLPKSSIEFMLENKEIFKQLEIIKFVGPLRNYVIENNINMDYFFNHLLKNIS